MTEGQPIPTRSNPVKEFFGKFRRQSSSQPENPNQVTEQPRYFRGLTPEEIAKLPVKKYEYEELVEGMDSEAAREEAKEIYKLEDDTANLLRSFGYDGPTGAVMTDHTTVERMNWFTGLTYHHAFQGLGSGDFNLTTWDSPFSNHEPDFLGIKDANDGEEELNVIHLKLHGDEKTMQQVEELAQSDPSILRSLETVFVFNADGKFGKLVTLPGAIDDERTPVYIYKSWDTPKEDQKKYYKSPVSPRDFEIVGRGLNMLKGELNSFISTNLEPAV